MEQQGMTMQECKENYDVLVKLLSQVQDENEHILKALHDLEHLPVTGTPGDIAGQARANAIKNVIVSRETTNQELLKIYGRMYCDLRGVLFPHTSSERN